MSERIVRRLAKSNKFQTIYVLAKEGSTALFINQANYTNMQILFLNYLNYYNSIYTDIAMDYVIDVVLEDEIYEDAYMYYRSAVKMKDVAESVNKPKKEDNNELNSFSWVLKKPKK